jgi:hypothetical protein
MHCQKTLVASLLALTFIQNAGAASLPSGLSADDIRESLKTISLGALHRGWTTHGQPYEGRLGMNLGLESVFIPARRVERLGDGNGTLPGLIPVPRFWVGFQYSSDIYISGSFAPGKLFDGIQVYGGGAQWIFQNDKEREVQLSLAFNYSYIDLFSDLKGNHMALLFGASKDLLVWQPYFMCGVAIGNGTGAAGIMDSGVKRGPYTVVSPQLSVGARIDLLAKLSFQLDVIGTKAAGALLLEKDF